MILALLLVLTVSASDLENCSIFYPQSSTCLKCEDSYQPNIKGQCSPSLIAGCAIYASDDHCFQCRPSFTLNESKCQQDLSGCIEYSDEGKCLKCGYGTKLQNQQCGGVLFCEEHKENMECEKCMQGYSLSDNKCIDQSTNCLQTNNDSGICTSCDNNSVLIGFICIPEQSIIEDCALYDNSYNCMQCQFYFELDQSLQKCSVLDIESVKQRYASIESVKQRYASIESTQPSHLIMIKTQQSPGSNLKVEQAADPKTQSQNQDGNIVQANLNQALIPQLLPEAEQIIIVNVESNIIANCQQYDEEGKCSKCDPKYQLISEKCHQIPIGCVKLTNDPSLCEVCDNRFSLLDGKCLDINCGGFFMENKNQCIFCNQGFTYNDDAKVCMDNNCAKVEKGKCLTCNKDYFLHKGRDYCLRVNQQNCVAYQNPRCLNCPRTHFPTNLGCSPFIFGCILYDIQVGTCLHCQEGLKLQGNVCINLNCKNQLEFCLECKQNYTLTKQGLCLDPNCEKYEKENCTKCKVDFFLTNAKQCIQTPKNCSKISPEGKCTQCLPNYILNNGACAQAKKIENCVRTDKDNKCLVCSDRYYLSANKQSCRRVGYLCDSFSPQTGFCFNCTANIALVQGKCLDQNCLLSTTMQCSSCKPGYLLNATSKVCQKNDPYCEQKFNGKCITCKDGFYLDAQEICVKLPTGCMFANYVNGDCLECKPEFILNNFKCQPRPRIQNCQRINAQNPQVCDQCQSNYFINPEKKCSAVSSLCVQGLYDPSNGRCLECIQGLELNISTGRCFIPNCQTQNGSICLECIRNFIVDTNDKCVFNDPNCESNGFDQCLICKSGFYKEGPLCYKLPNQCEAASDQGKKCIKCQEGYTLNSLGSCERLIRVEIANCRAYSQNRCIQCQDRYFLSDGECLEVEEGCLTYNPNTGGCTTCKQGYVLQGSSCRIRPTQLDPNCKKFSGGACQECSNRYYPNEEKVCVPVNPLCKDYDPNTGACTACYPSYIVQDRKCILAPNDDPNCKDFSENRLCQLCFNGYFPKQGKCQRVNPLCKAYNEKNGDCLSCYPGYELSGKSCVIFFRDPNCKQFDTDSKCLECVTRYYPQDNLCTPVNPLCKTFNGATGACTSCYPGYAVSDRGLCVLSYEEDKYPNCKQVENETCIQCYNRYYSDDGVCRQVDPLCRGYNNETGACTNCYPGYKLQGDDCILPDPQEVDGNCKRFSTSNPDFCLECYQGFTVVKGKCEIRDDLCSNYSQSEGKCLGCYIGYNLNQENRCVLTPIRQTVTGINDINCIKIQGKDCIQCADGFYLDSDKMCKQANPQCRTISNDGKCTSCYPGFVLTNGDCLDPRSSEISLPFCERYNSNGGCIQCIDRYYLQDGKCASVSILCGDYDMNTGNCLSCNSPFFNLQKGKCIQLVSIVEGCSEYEGPFCSKCRKQYYFLAYSCIRIDKQCTKFDYDRKECQTCSGGKKPIGANCQ